MSTAEPVGSLAEEAAKLFTIVQQWGQAASAGFAGSDHSDGGEHDDPDAAQAATEREHQEYHEHGADVPDSACRHCPICAVRRLVRDTSPEVRGQFSAAAASFGLAVKALLDEHLSPPQSADGEAPHPGRVEKIDLAEDGDDD